MTKQELLTDLESKDFVDGIVVDATKTEDKPDGSKTYIVNIREVVGNSAIYRNISFYVVDEGEETERAFYQEKEPVQTLAEVV